MPPCPRWWVASGPPLRFRRPQCRPSAATGGPISSLVGGWPQCLPSADQAPPYPPSTRGPQAFSGATAHSRAAAKHTHRSHLPARPCAPFFLSCLPPLPPAPCRHHAPFSSIVDGWLNASFPATQAHLSLPPFPPASPCLPPRADTRHPPWVARPITARPFPIRRPALTVRLPYSTQATFGGGLFPPPLHPYTPGFGIGHRPPWPGVVCCPHPPGAALLPGRKVLGPTLQPIDKEHASPPIYLPPPPLRGSQTTPLCLTVTVQVNRG